MEYSTESIEKVTVGHTFEKDCVASPNSKLIAINFKNRTTPTAHKVDSA